MALRDRAKGTAAVLAVPFTYLLVLLVGPVIAVCAGAFSRGLGAFLHAVGSPDALHAFALTAYMAAFAVILNALFGLAIAWVLSRDDFRGRALLGGMVDLPFAISPVVVGLMAMLLFGRQGWLRPVTDALHLRILFAWPAVALTTTFVSLPIIVREVAPVLEEIGWQEEEAARTLGANRFQTFYRVVLPNVRWALLYGTTLTVARAIGEFGAVLLVSGGIVGKTETATMLVYRQIEERHESAAQAVAVVLACVSVMLLLGMDLAKHRRDRELGAGAGGHPA